MKQTNQLSRDELNKAHNERLPVYRNGNEFVIAAMYWSDSGAESKWLIDYYKVSSKFQRIRTRDLISFCKSFTTTKDN